MALRRNAPKSLMAEEAARLPPANGRFFVSGAVNSGFRAKAPHLTQLKIPFGNENLTLISVW